MKKKMNHVKFRKLSECGILCALHFSDPMNAHSRLEHDLVLFIEGSSFLPKQLPFSKDYLANTSLSSTNQIRYSEI